MESLLLLLKGRERDITAIVFLSLCHEECCCLLMHYDLTFLVPMMCCYFC